MAIPIGEALLAVTGLTAALRPGPVRVNQEVMGKAMGLEKTIQRRLRHFVRDKELAEMPELPDFDFEEIAQLLPGAEEEARNIENVSKFKDQGLAEAYATALGGAIGYMKAHAPAETLPALVGSKSMTPSDLDTSEFRRRYQTVDAFTNFLEQILAGAVVPDQVDTLSACLPGVFGFMHDTLLQEMVLAGTEKASFQLPYEKDQALQVLLQADTLTPDLHDELTKAFEAAREKESGIKADGTPSTSQNTKDIAAISTQQQRLEAK